MFRILAFLLLLFFSAPLAAQNGRVPGSQQQQTLFSENKSAQASGEHINEAVFFISSSDLSSSEALILLKNLRNCSILKKNSVAFSAASCGLPHHLSHFQPHVLHPGERLLRLMKIQR